MNPHKATGQGDAVDWRSYAAVYDLMAEINPAYQDLVNDYRRFVLQQWLHPEDLLLELGAGTGNFSLVAADEWPECRVLHVDASEAMNAEARRKRDRLGLTNIEIRTQDIADLDLPDESATVITAVHALYAFPDPRSVIRDMFRWLSPGGTVFACDPGRPLDMREWTRYLFRSSRAERGLWGSIRLFWRCREVAAQNRRIARSQQAGTYWRHDASSFAQAFTEAGFEVDHCRGAYRGASDLLVARKAVAVAPLHLRQETIQAPL